MRLWYASVVLHSRSIKNYGLSILVIALASLPFVFSRIQSQANPRSEARFQIHLGDGCTEDGWVLPAVAYWKKHSLGSTLGIPCLREGENGQCSVGYLHYPPAAFVATYSLFTIHDSMVFARWATYVIGVLAMAFALVLMAQSLVNPRRFIVLASALVGFAPGFWLYADHWFWHGVSLSFFGIGFGMLMLSASALAYGSFVFGVMWVNPEPVPALVLLALALGPRLKMFRAAIVGALIALALRAVHNAFFLGSLRETLTDLATIVQGRMSGNAQVPFDANWTWLGYLDHMKHGYATLATKPVLLLTVIVFLFIARSSRQVACRLALLSAIAVSWNFIMIEHSRHFFTFRHFVWVPVLTAFYAFKVTGSQAAGREATLGAEA